MALRPQSQAFSRAASSYQEAAFVQQGMAERLAEIYARADIEPPGRVLELGCGTGNLTFALLSHPKLAWPDPLDYVLTDLSPAMLEEARKHLKCSQKATFTLLSLSAEAAGGLEPFEEKAEAVLAGNPFGLIAASAVFQWIPAEKLEGFFSGLGRRLSPEGTLLFSTFAPGTLGEILALTGRGLDYPSAEKLGTLLCRTGFETIAFEEREERIRFDGPIDVLRHLRATGVNGLSSGRRPAFSTRSALNAFASAYRERFGTEDGGVTLTWKPLFFLVRKK